jgi:diamine N-acetyltransferase
MIAILSQIILGKSKGLVALYPVKIERSEKMSVTLREINMENFQECISLKVAQDQEGFVATNVYSLAEAKADSVSIPLAIYDGETMVGFLMYWFDETNGVGWIDRLMVDARFQKRGYGRTAMTEVIRRLKSHANCRLIRTSFAPENAPAARLYESLGFVRNNQEIAGETVVILENR